jgi:hypothetical protein
MNRAPATFQSCFTIVKNSIGEALSELLYLSWSQGWRREPPVVGVRLADLLLYRISHAANSRHAADGKTTN